MRPQVFAAKRGQIELYARTMEERAWPGPPSAVDLSTVAGLYRVAVIDGTIQVSPAEYVRRPKIDTESATLGLDRMELGAFIARGSAGSAVDQALACLDCSGCASPRLCISTSSTSASSEATARSPCWARAPSSP